MEPDVFVEYAPLLLRAALVTIELSIASSVVGTAIGMICALLQVGGPRAIVVVVRIYIWIMRGLPPLVVLIFTYYALPAFSIELEPFPAAVIAIGMGAGAFWAEVFRAGIVAIPAGQWDAARALGLRSHIVLLRVVLPQAFRIILPPYVNGLISLVKETSLASAVTLGELTLASQRAYSASFRPVEILTMTAILYMAMTSFLMVIQSWLERSK
jgi:His/Glu/Gln/Arg/opine family amino acid ABC transporter permease subunit